MEVGESQPGPSLKEKVAAITKSFTMKNASDRKRKLRAKKNEEAGNPERMKCFVKMNGFRVKSTSQKNGNGNQIHAQSNSVPTTSTPVSIVVAAAQSNSTTLPMNSEENSMTVTTASTPVSIVVASTQSNSTTLPMTSRGVVGDAEFNNPPTPPTTPMPTITSSRVIPSTSSSSRTRPGNAAKPKPFRITEVGEWRGKYYFTNPISGDLRPYPSPQLSPIVTKIRQLQRNEVPIAWQENGP